MTLPRNTPGGLGRVRALIKAILPTREHSLPRQAARATLLAAALAAAVALTGAAVGSDSQAAPPPDGPRMYKATADLDGRYTPNKSNVAAVDFVKKNEWVEIECQKYGGPAYGSRLWDLVTNHNIDSPRDTYFVPDRFIKTGSDGRVPGIRGCDWQDYP